MTARQPGWADTLEELLRQRWGAGEEFTLDEVYKLRGELERARPDAKNLDARIRDALQQLKHRRRLDFVAKGRYRLTRA